MRETAGDPGEKVRLMDLVMGYVKQGRAQIGLASDTVVWSCLRETRPRLRFIVPFLQTGQ